MKGVAETELASRQEERGDAVLDVRGLTVAYGGNIAVNSVSLAVRAGEIVALIGPNGAGKTSILNAISGTIRATSGTIRLSGRDVSRSSFASRSRLGLSRTFQIPRSSTQLTVEEQVSLSVHGFRGAWPWRRDRDSAGILESELAGMGLLERRTRLTGSLSLGEYRLFEIARAAAARPVVVLSDETASGMDAEGAGVLRSALLLLASRGAAILLVEHNIPFVRTIAGRVVVVDLGKVIAEGPAESVLASDVVRDAYLGTQDA